MTLLQTKSGQTWTINHVVSYIEKKSEVQIQIKRIDFTFPLNLHLEDVLISKNHQQLVAIQNLEVFCSCSKLLQGRVVISDFKASNIHLSELDDFSLTTNETNGEGFASYIPFYLKLENIDIQRVNLDPRIIQKTLSLPFEIRELIKDSYLNLQGTLTHNPFLRSQTAHLLVTAKNDQNTQTMCSLGIDSQNQQLSLSFHCNQVPLHLLAKELSPNGKAHFAIFATAPITNWQNFSKDLILQDSPIEGHFKVSVDASPGHSVWIEELLSQEIFIRSHFLIKSKSEIEIFNLKIDHPLLFLDGNASFGMDQKINYANFIGEIPDFNKLQPFLKKNVKGKMVLEGQAGGFLYSPSFKIQAASSSFSFEDHDFQHVVSSFQASLNNHGWNGFFSLDFNYQNLPSKFSTLFNLSNDYRLTLHQLKAEAMNLEMNGQLTCCAPDYSLEGILEFDSQNLNEVANFFKIPLAGNGKLVLQLSSFIDNQLKNQQKLTGHLKGDSLNWKDWKAHQLDFQFSLNSLYQNPQNIQVESLLEANRIQWKDCEIGHCQISATHDLDVVMKDLRSLSVNWQAEEIKWPDGKAGSSYGKAYLNDPLQIIEGDIQLYLKNLETPILHLDELDWMSSIYSKDSNWPFQISAKGFAKEKFHLHSRGTWNFNFPALDVRVIELSGAFGQYPLSLLNPFHFLRHSEGIILEGFEMLLGDAEIKCDFSLDRENIFSKFKTNLIPSELFRYVVPELPLAGRAAIQGEISGLKKEPRGQLQIDVNHIQIIEDIFANKPFIDGKVNLQLDQNGVQLNSELKGIGKTPLWISGTLPFTLSLEPIQFKINPLLPFDIALNAEGDFDPYLHLFYNDVTNLSGQAKIALRLSGKMDQPNLQGHIDLENGSYESLSTGALYHHIQAHLEGDGSKIVLSKFSAHDNKNGIITATGTVFLDANKQFPFDFNINPKHIFIMDSDYAAISASGPLTLTGNIKDSKLQGELTIDEAVIRLEEALPHQIKTVDVQYTNLAEGEKAPNHSEPLDKNSSTHLDVKLKAPGNVKIQSSHLKSDWKGLITITGTPDNLQFNGDLRVMQGIYDFNGKEFNLSQGTIHFAGPLDKKTTLYVVASKDIDRIIAEIIVKGPAIKPVISFRSNPPLSQREVLSYILFNRGISDITVDQGDQLSQSFISLNADQSKSSDDFLSRLRNNIGFDRLDFITNDKENKDIGLQIGKNITENISVSVNQSMTSVAPIIAVEAKIRKNLKAQAERGVIADAPVRMSLKWKKDY